jgi:uncharacterized protein YkwD
VALTQVEQELFVGQNNERTNAGLPPLQIDPQLVAVARHRAQDMASKGYFAHQSPTGETAFTLLDAAGYTYYMAGENIARNNYPLSEAAAVALSGFMNSAPHRANILHSAYSVVGIGYAVTGDGLHYIAVVFAGF